LELSTAGGVPAAARPRIEKARSASYCLCLPRNSFRGRPRRDPAWPRTSNVSGGPDEVRQPCRKDTLHAADENAQGLHANPILPSRRDSIMPSLWGGEQLPPVAPPGYCLPCWRNGTGLLGFSGLKGVLRMDYARGTTQSLPRACRGACCAGSRHTGDGTPRWYSQAMGMAMKGVSRRGSPKS